MAVDSSGLVRAAMDLRASSPAVWYAFVTAVQEYAQAMTQEMVKAQPDMLLRAQGMSIMALEIAGILAMAPQMHDKMQNLQRGRADGRRPGPGSGTGF